MNILNLSMVVCDFCHKETSEYIPICVNCNKPWWDKYQFKTPPIPVNKLQFCKHDGYDLPLDNFSVRLGQSDFLEYTKEYSFISLNGKLPKSAFSHSVTVINAQLEDFGGVNKWWNNFIYTIAKNITLGKKYAAYCTMGHGRTGTFAASLVAVMLASVDDPIEYVREHYCKFAVETYEQVEAIFNLANKPTPDKYLKLKKHTKGVNVL